MKRRRLRARDRRALLLGLIAVTPFAVYRSAVGPWLTYRTGLRDALAAERDLLARERASIRDTASVPAQAGRVERLLAETEPWLLDGSSPVAAASRLTRLVTETAQSVGILVQEVRGRELVSPEPPLTEVSVTVRAIGDLEGLARLLFTMENEARLVRVSDLSLGAAGVNDGDLERGQLMSAAFTLVGYWRAPADAGRVAAPVGQ